VIAFLFGFAGGFLATLGYLNRAKVKALIDSFKTPKL